MEGRVYTPEEVAEQLRVAPATVRYWLRTGALRGFQLGRQWRVREADLRAFIEASANVPPAEGDQCMHRVRPALTP